MTRKALGRGLGALIPESVRSREVYQEIDLDLIDPNPYQPRTHTNRGDLEGLAASIRESGVAQPILVRRRADRFQLVAGERRWLASQQAGLLKIPAVIRDIPDERLLEYALIENIQRQELSAIEEAQAYKQLMGDLGMTQEEVASKVGKDRATVANIIRLLKLPMTVRNWVHEGKLSMGHARALLALETESQKLVAAREILAKGLSVRATEAAVKRITAAGDKARKAQAAASTADPNVASVVDQLRQALGTKVEILGRPKRGKIVVHYYSEEDLERLFHQLAAAR